MVYMEKYKKFIVMPGIKLILVKDMMASVDKSGL